MAAYRDGSQRLLPEIVIECGLGCYVVTVRDHESGLQASFESDMWRDIPAALDGLLARGRLPWRPFRSFRKKERKTKDDQ